MNRPKPSECKCQSWTCEGYVSLATVAVGRHHPSCPHREGNPSAGELIREQFILLEEARAMVSALRLEVARLTGERDAAMATAVRVAVNAYAHLDMDEGQARAGLRQSMAAWSEKPFEAARLAHGEANQ